MTLYVWLYVCDVTAVFCLTLQTLKKKYKITQNKQTKTKNSRLSPSHLSPCLASPHSRVPQCSQKVGLL